MTAQETLNELTDLYGITSVRPGLRHYVSRKVGDGWSFARIEKGASRAGLLKDWDFAADHFSNGPSRS